MKLGVLTAFTFVLFNNNIKSIYGTVPATVETQCVFKTSSSSYSGTSDIIYGSFIGDIATSGSHALGSFGDGSTVVVDITLDRLIGPLKGLLLFTNGTDGWLLSESTCEIEGRVFALHGKKQWLDSLDLDLLNEHGDGFEPFAQITLPASPTMLLSVYDSWLAQTSDKGVFKPPISNVD